MNASDRSNLVWKESPRSTYCVLGSIPINRLGDDQTPHFLICRRKTAKSQIVERAIRWGKTTKETTDVCDLVRYSKQRDTCTRGDFFHVLRRGQLFGQVGLTYSYSYRVGSLNIISCMQAECALALFDLLDSIGSDTESRPPRAWRHGSQRRGANHVAANHVANQLISRRQRATSSTSLMRGDDRRAA